MRECSKCSTLGHLLYKRYGTPLDWRRTIPSFLNNTPHFFKRCLGCQAKNIDRKRRHWNVSSHLFFCLIPSARRRFLTRSLNSFHNTERPTFSPSLAPFFSHSDSPHSRCTTLYIYLVSTHQINYANRIHPRQQPNTPRVNEQTVNTLQTTTPRNIYIRATKRQKQTMS